MNDPYENRVLNPEIDVTMLNFEKIVGNNVELASAFLSGDTYKLTDNHNNVQHEFDTRWGVLSLSRNPKNLLMWSHYADEHKGVVVGIDVSDAMFYGHGIVFNPEKGNVIYSAVKPKSLKLASEIEYVPHEQGGGYTTKYRYSGVPAKLDETFLYKAIDWAYEDEVRIVRDLHEDKGEVVVNKEDQEVCLFPLPKRLIKSVIFGERYNQELLKSFSKENSELGIQVFQAKIDNEEYKMRLELIEKEVTPKVIKPEIVKPPVIMKGVMQRGVSNNSKKKKRK